MKARSDTGVVRRRVDVAGAPYDVVVGEGLLARLGELVRDACGARTVALVTDSTVADHFGIAADTSLARAGLRVEAFTVAAGEGSKSWAVAGDLLEGFAGVGMGRDDAVVALGGGVVGDLAGFAAAVYHRGVVFIQVPTTLLAMVDSSVGGKTAVDLTAGKNLAGAFKQPAVVVADVDTLATLPEEQWASGLAEVAKSAVLSGDDFLCWLEDAAPRIVAREREATVEAIVRSVAFKAAVVAGDEKEAGPRECLNYGHTLGHALERALGYGTITHGAAVAEGMRFAARVAVEVSGAAPDLVKRQDRLLDALGLPALDADVLGDSVHPAALLELMRGDKKARGGVVRMVLVARPGEWHCEPVADDTVRDHLKAWMASKKGE